MTAIVGVLNRQGVAFAADSAATRKFGKEYRVNYHANKIFSLSKYHPVGVCVYNKLSFLGVPWETIFKMFRDELKDKNFKTLQEYIGSFWLFVKKNILNSFENDQKEYFEEVAKKYWDDVKSLALKDIGGTLTTHLKSRYFLEIERLLNEFKISYSSKQCIDFNGYDLKKFLKYGSKFIESTISIDISDPECPKNLRKEFIESLYAIITNPKILYYPNDDYTGLVFWGYGDNDVYPGYIEQKVTHVFDKHVKYWTENCYSVSNKSTACIAPFAQTDVTNTFIRSVDEKLRQEFIESSKRLIEQFRDEIVDNLRLVSAPSALLDILIGIDCEKYKNKYADGMKAYIDKNYINNLIETVAYLSKEDLADMADNLVRMTCLKRHITSELESVGGPVDVAVITKGDGFVWIKRKHYFDPDLNQHFFDRNKNR